jgi:hypothetical protein
MKYTYQIDGGETLTSNSPVISIPGAILVSWEVEAEDIKKEAERRIIAACGARDLEDCRTKQLNALMQAASLNNQLALGQQLSAEEMAEASMLAGLSAKIEAIRKRSDELEASLPKNFWEDSHWL